MFLFFSRQDARPDPCHQTNWSPRQSCQQGMMLIIYLLFHLYIDMLTVSCIMHIHHNMDLNQLSLLTIL